MLYTHILACKECLKPSRNMLTWSDAKQVCAIDGKVLPLHINEELLDTGEDFVSSNVIFQDLHSKVNSLSGRSM